MKRCQQWLKSMRAWFQQDFCWYSEEGRLLKKFVWPMLLRETRRSSWRFNWGTSFILDAIVDIVLESSSDKFEDSIWLCAIRDQNPSGIGLQASDIDFSKNTRSWSDWWNWSIVLDKKGLVEVDLPLQKPDVYGDNVNPIPWTLSQDFHVSISKTISSRWCPWTMKTILMNASLSHSRFRGIVRKLILATAWNPEDRFNGSNPFWFFQFIEEWVGDQASSAGRILKQASSNGYQRPHGYDTHQKTPLLSDVSRQSFGANCGLFDAKGIGRPENIQRIC